MQTDEVETAPPLITPAVARAVGTVQVLGWIILFAALSRTMMVVAPLILMIISKQAAGILALFSVPVWLLTVAGAVGLIRVRFWGFKLIYSATVLSLFFANVPYAAGTSLFPLIERWLQFGPLNPLVLKALNLGLVGFLAWNHLILRRASGAPPLGIRQSQGIALGLMAMFGMGVWWNWLDYKTGSVGALAEVHPIGTAFQNFSTEGPVNVRGTYHPRFKGVMLVCSGKVTESTLTNFVSRAQLHAAPMPQALPKRLPLAKQWRLPEELFPREFGEQDFGWVGRMPGHRKMVIQVWWRPADGRFTMEIFGMLSGENSIGSAPLKMERPDQDEPLANSVSKSNVNSGTAAPVRRPPGPWIFASVNCPSAGWRKA